MMPSVKDFNGSNYLLTGATGFLGSHILTALLRKGNRVNVAGRSTTRISLKERIQRLLKWFGIEYLESMVDCFETDFLKAGLGLDNDSYKNLLTNSDYIIHCASDTSFSESSRERVIRSNVDSLFELIKFAEKCRIKCFYFISTAYSVGKDCIECPEDPVNSIHFNNVYEESKALAETTVLDGCRKNRIPFVIIRPSIVYGDSITGKSLKFNALYYPVKSLMYIRDIYLNDIVRNNGAKSINFDIFVNSKGMLNLPIRVFLPKDGIINLIPVDYFTNAILSILEDNSKNIFVNITSKKPESILKIALYIEKYLNISGIDIIVNDGNRNMMRNPPEELFDHFIMPYLPYLSDTRNFIRKNTDKITRNLAVPELNYELFEKCMNYAVSVDWGKNLFVDY